LYFVHLGVARYRDKKLSGVFVGFSCAATWFLAGKCIAQRAPRGQSLGRLMEKGHSRAAAYGIAFDYGEAKIAIMVRRRHGVRASTLQMTGLEISLLTPRNLISRAGR
jgi:hypothetical protein